MPDNLTSEQRCACMRAVKSQNTTPELFVRSLLHRLGCRFSLNRSDLPGKPDIVLPSRGCIILVHGCFWHGHTCARGRRQPVTNGRYWRMKIERNRHRDRRALNALRRKGWRVLVVWECETRDQIKLAKRLATFLAAKPSYPKAERPRVATRQKSRKIFVPTS